MSDTKSAAEAPSLQPSKMSGGERAASASRCLPYSSLVLPAAGWPECQGHMFVIFAATIVSISPRRFQPARDHTSLSRSRSPPFHRHAHARVRRPFAGFSTGTPWLISAYILSLLARGSLVSRKAGSRTSCLEIRGSSPVSPIRLFGLADLIMVCPRCRLSPPEAAASSCRSHVPSAV